MLEMQLQLRHTSNDSVRAEMEAMRQEIRSLRDTTMQYDLSFDTALQRLEQRVEGIERRSISSGETSSGEISNIAGLRNGR
jgi:hypothetical protein